MTLASDRQRVSTYRERIIDEIVRALGISPSGAARRLLGPLFRLPAGAFRPDHGPRRHARSGLTGLPGGARSILRDFGLEPVVWGAELIPTEGPLVVASNHPGAYDSLALMAAVPRPDLKIVHLGRRFHPGLPGSRQAFHLCAGTPRPDGRRPFVSRSAISPAGGALLIYPHTEVEPDPETGSGAAEALGEWSRSLEIMLRRVPRARLQVAIASGILLPRFVNSPARQDPQGARPSARSWPSSCRSAGRWSSRGGSSPGSICRSRPRSRGAISPPAA